MKNKIFALFSLSILSFGLVGCDDRTTPIDTVKTLLSALQEDDLSNFRNTLSRSTQASLGTAAAMNVLKDIIVDRISSMDRAVYRSTVVRRVVSGSVTLVDYRVLMVDGGSKGVTFSARCLTTEHTRSGSNRRAGGVDQTSVTPLLHHWLGIASSLFGIATAAPTAVSGYDQKIFLLRKLSDVPIILRTEFHHCYLTLILLITGCAKDPSVFANRGFVIQNVSPYQDHVYFWQLPLFIQCDSAPIGCPAMLTIFDASDPANPVLVETRDVGPTQNFLVADDKLRNGWGYASTASAGHVSPRVRIGYPQPFENDCDPKPGGLAPSSNKRPGTILEPRRDGIDSASATTYFRLANTAGRSHWQQQSRCREAVGVSDHLLLAAVGEAVAGSDLLSPLGALSEVRGVADSTLKLTQDAQALMPTQCWPPTTLARRLCLSWRDQGPNSHYC